MAACALLQGRMARPKREDQQSLDAALEQKIRKESSHLAAAKLRGSKQIVESTYACGPVWYQDAYFRAQIADEIAPCVERSHDSYIVYQPR